MPDVGIKLGAACMPSERTSDPATAPGHSLKEIFPVSTVMMDIVSIFCITEICEIRQIFKGDLFDKIL